MANNYSNSIENFDEYLRILTYQISFCVRGMSLFDQLENLDHEPDEAQQIMMHIGQDCLSKVMAITDKKQSSDITIYLLKNELDYQKINNDELESLYKKIMDESRCEKLRRTRNKVVSHFDKKNFINVLSETPGLELTELIKHMVSDINEYLVKFLKLYYKDIYINLKNNSMNLANIFID